MIRVLLQREPPPSLDVLSAGERARAAGMRVQKRRDEFVLGRWAAKRLIGSALRRAADDSIDLRASASGAPEAFVDGDRIAWSISISHREGLALAALDDTGAALGADLELIEPRSAAFVRDYFTEEERRHARDALMTNVIWSAKESALKALRTGLRADTRSVQVHLLQGPTAPWHRFCIRGALNSDGWWLAQARHVVTVVGASEPHLSP